ncbi:MAG: PAS domain S-box protein [Rhodothermales bacterium]
MDLRKYIAPDQAVFPALLDHITDVCLAIDTEGRIRFANRASERLMRRPLDQLAGLHLFTLVHEDDHAAITELLTQLAESPEDVLHHTFRLAVNDATRILESTWSTARRSDTEILFLMNAHDATERVSAQMKVRQREEELARAERVAQLATWERNLTTNQFSASKQLLEIYGISRDSNIAFKDLARFVPPEDLAMVQESMHHAQQSLGSIAIDHRITRMDGQERIVHIRGTVELNGKDFIMYGTAQDVTEMRTMERALRASEQRFRAIFDSTFQFIGLMKPDGTLIEANETALRFAGVEREDVIDRPFWDCYWWSIGTAQQERLKEAVRVAASGRFVRYNTEVYGAGERLTTIDFSIKPIFGADGQVVMLIPEGRDITDEMAAQRALQNSEALYRSLVTSLSDGVLLIDADGQIVATNPSAERMLGQPEHVLIGRNVRDDWHAVREDGSALSPEEYPAVRALESREPLRNQVIGLQMPAGGMRWVSINAEPIARFEGGYDNAVVLSLTDLTSRIRHEEQLQRSHRRLRELAAQLHSAQEEERARIAREVHDVLGQAMTSLRLDIVWLLDHYPVDDPAFSKRANATLKLVEETITTVRRISHELRPGVLDHFGLPTAIEWLCEQHQQRTDIAFTTVDETDGLIDDLDPKLAIALFRIFQEALNNVMKHADAASVRTHLEIVGDSLRVEIADDGRGITPDDIEHATSLGLLNMRERILPWNGTISIAGEPDQGTCITVTVPLP